MTSGQFANVISHRREKEIDTFAECLGGTTPCGGKALAYWHLIYHNSICESRKFLQCKVLFIGNKGRKGKTA